MIPRKSKGSYDILLYTPGSSGTGHIVRINLLAEALTESGYSCLMVSGSPDYLRLPTHSADRLMLPRMVYSRNQQSLDREYLSEFYGKTLRLCIEEFSPRLFITTHHYGIHGELKHIFGKGNSAAHVHKILAWRDIPAGLAEVEFWKNHSDLIRVITEEYNEIAVLGQNDIMDIAVTYSFPHSIKNKIHYMGYVSDNLITRNIRSPQQKRQVLIAFGEGQNRENLINDPLPQIVNSIIALNLRPIVYCGALWDAEKFKNVRLLLGDRGDIRPFMSRDDYLAEVANSQLVVLGGGYNSTIEALCLNKNVIVMEATEPKNCIAEVVLRNELFKKRNIIRIARSGISLANMMELLQQPFQMIPNKLLLNGQKFFAEFVSTLTLQ